MNERIRELAKEARLIQAKDFKSGDEVKNIVFGDGLEKFAELIVKECAEVIDNGRFSAMECEGNSHRVSYNNGIYYALSSVKKHFGVEE